MEQSRNDRPQWGPKMAALPNDRWRAFVEHYLVLGGKGGGAEAARRAGFKGNDVCQRTVAYRMTHDIRIQEALQEEARRSMVGLVPAALRVLESTVDDPKNLRALDAAKTVLDRAGLHEVREVEHNHKFIADDPLMLERVRQLAERLGVPVEQLIGRSAAMKLLPVTVAVEAEFEEVEQ